MLGPATTALLLLAPLAARAQVTATGPNGPTNPSAPGLGAHNQTSESRLVSLNSVEDFCLFAPSMPNSAIGNVEAEVVAWCTKERNGARLIPDGCVPSRRSRGPWLAHQETDPLWAASSQRRAITAAHFVKTPLYVQVQGRGDLTKLNIAAGDDGGELDPHGAENLGNPIGGNVTSNVSGADVFYEEWMSFMSFGAVCFVQPLYRLPDRLTFYSSSLSQTSSASASARPRTATSPLPFSARCGRFRPAARLARL
jgi:hypothetical protein